MTVMEYLSQGYRLDMKIKSRLEEQRALTEMSRSVSSPRLCERVQTSKNADAPFVRYCERAEDLGIRISAEVDSWSKAGGMRCMDQRSHGGMSPAWSTVSPRTLKIRPSVARPTGTVIPSPLSVTGVSL